MGERRRRETRGYPRGEQARLRILEAALVAFGEAGFDGASTRAIARAADVTLPAIQYYFGGKQGLYLACADYVAARLEARLGESIASAEALIRTGPGADAARELLLRLVSSFAELLLGEREPEMWTMFVVREQAHPTQAFELLYSRAIGRMASVVVDLTAEALGADRDAAEVRVRAFALIGQVIAFRAARATALRTLGVDSYTPETIATITAALRKQVACALSPLAQEGRSPT